MASIRYEITKGVLPITVNLLDGVVIIDTNIHNVYEEGEFVNVPEGNYTIQMIENNGCEYFLTVGEGGCGLGLLYNWYAVNDARSIVADGWHVITWDEVSILSLYVGGVGNDLAEMGTDYWNVDFGTNSTGMSLRGSGRRTYNTGLFNGIYSTFYGWNSDDFNANYARSYIMSTDGDIYYDTISHKRCGYGVRLVKDDETLESYTGNDGKVYQTVKIGGLVVTAQSIAETKYANGELISHEGVNDGYYTNAEWAVLTDEAMCPYNNDWTLACLSGEIVVDVTTTTSTTEESTTTTTTTCNPLKCDYGLLYNWYAVDTGKLAPTGWHVPSDSEWTTLITYLGGESVAGGKMKTTETCDWYSPNTGATNESGFSGLPGGFRNEIGYFQDVAYNGYWWFSNEYSTIYAWGWFVSYIYADAEYFYSAFKEYGFSVRCVRDYYEGYPSTIQDYDGNTYGVIEIGTQLWTVQNLKVTHYNDGEVIPNITDDTEWSNLATGALCAYDNDWETYACVTEPTTSTTTTIP